MGDEPGADDLVELGGRPFRLPGWLSSRLPNWRPPRGAGVFAAAALVIGLVVGLAGGYAAGDHARGAVPPAPSASSASSGPPTFPFAGSPGPAATTSNASASQDRLLTGNDRWLLRRERLEGN